MLKVRWDPCETDPTQIALWNGSKRTGKQTTITSWMGVDMLRSLQPSHSSVHWCLRSGWYM